MPRILLLEDEPFLVQTLPAVLKDKHSELQVVGQVSITQALAQLEAEDFDAVLLDISMPPTDDMDWDEIEHGRLTGIEVARRIKLIKPKIPIVVLTVVSDPLIQRKIWETGVVAIINKPAEAEQIAEALLRATR